MTVTYQCTEGQLVQSGRDARACTHARIQSNGPRERVDNDDTHAARIFMNILDRKQKSHASQALAQYTEAHTVGGCLHH